MKIYFEGPIYQDVLGYNRMVAERCAEWWITRYFAYWNIYLVGEMREKLMKDFAEKLEGFSVAEVLMGLDFFSCKHQKMPFPDEVLLAIKAKTYEEYLRTDSMVWDREKSAPPTRVDGAIH